MKKFAIASCALVLAACGSSDSGTITTEDGETVEYDIDRSGSDAGSMSIKTEDGELNLNMGPGTKVDLPSGFAVYPGATVISNTTMNHSEGASTSVMMTAPASQEKVLAYYRKQAEAAGVEINTEMTMDETRIIGGRTAGGLNFSLTTAPADEGTSVNLSLVQNKGG